ncbi:MAG: adenylate/guanylate cyclase domain-containing protein [Acidimicrobiia bacterium]|nr:adenylate/guanylate cyclase domain-containing protein [Acidimicrobiia bacterium]
MSGALPDGTVTLLFTDIEGSTKVLDSLGLEAYTEALEEHRRVLREAFRRHGGVEVGTAGDSFFVAFPTAPGAVQAAREGQEALVGGPVRVRMGLHTGTPLLTGGDYTGADVHLAARIAAAGHGGQVLLSKATRELISVDVTPLGEHRLKDFESPVGIYQLGSERFPPLKTISNTNLPRPASSFVGRAREVSEVAALLGNGTRLLTLTGPGGSGKTRLAIEAATRLVPDFAAGVFWVGLAALRDPALVQDTIAQVLGAREDLAEHIGERHLLVVVDNLEQVVGAAPQLSALIEACPRLRMLTTSRERLRIRGEVEFPVPPLAESEAVDLFCSRAGVVSDDSILRLCRALENLPLAVELAAARASVLAPEQILERLSGRLDLLRGGRDSDPRQHTLRATIEWSYELLSDEEKRLFARLAVFRGGSTLEAAEQVTQADLDVLQSLVDKSLVRRTGARLWMLETIRDYAVERLEASGEAPGTRRCHAEYFASLAEEAYPHLTGNPRQWIDRLETEHDNFRAALDFLLTVGATQRALQLAGALWKYWYQRGHYLEGRQRLQAALSVDHSPTAARGRALNGATALEGEGGDVAVARACAEEALALHRDLVDEWGVANSLFLLGLLFDAAAAKPLLEESLALFNRLGDDHYIMLVSNNLAWIYAELGDSTREREILEESLARARAAGNRRMELDTLDSLAATALAQQRFDDARALLRDALHVASQLHEPFSLASVLIQVAAGLAAEGNAAMATRLLSAAEAIREKTGGSRTYVIARRDRALALIRGVLDEATFAAEWEQGQALTVEQTIDLALDTTA